jgi:hypothetical protein
VSSLYRAARSRRRLPLLLAPVVAGPSLVAVLWWGDGVPAHIPCPVHAVTGLLCPGCGSGRMLEALADGNVLLAGRQNPVAFAVAVFVVVAWVVAVWRWFARRPAKVGDRRLAVPVAVLLVLFTVLRNVPGFEWLAPIG